MKKIIQIANFIIVSCLTVFLTVFMFLFNFPMAQIHGFFSISIFASIIIWIISIAYFIFALLSLRNHIAEEWFLKWAFLLNMSSVILIWLRFTIFNVTNPMKSIESTELIAKAFFVISFFVFVGGYLRNKKVRRS